MDNYQNLMDQASYFAQNQPQPLRANNPQFGAPGPQNGFGQPNFHGQPLHNFEYGYQPQVPPGAGQPYPQHQYLAPAVPNSGGPLPTLPQHQNQVSPMHGSGSYRQALPASMNQNHGKPGSLHLGPPVFNWINVNGGTNNFQGNPLDRINQQAGGVDVSLPVNHMGMVFPDLAGIEIDLDDLEEPENKEIVAKTKDGKSIVRRANACVACKKAKIACQDVNGPHSGCKHCVEKRIPCMDQAGKGGPEFVRGDRHRATQARTLKLKLQQQQIANLIKENQALKDEINNLKQTVNIQNQGGNIQFGTALPSGAPSVNNWNFGSGPSAPAAGSMNNFGTNNHQNIQQPDQQLEMLEEPELEETGGFLA